MISKFRKGADHLLVRFLLGFIALSFVGIGGTAFIKGNSDGDVVTFSKADSISYEEFYRARAQEIDVLQRQSGANLSDENIAELGINKSVIEKLINNSMIEYLANYYQLDISDDKVIEYIQQAPLFFNENGEFDLSIFKSKFNGSIKKEAEYLNAMKKNLLHLAITKTFLDSVIVPTIMTDNIVNYMSETRVVDIVSIDLDSKLSGYKSQNISKEQAQEFYSKNQSIFTVPERRSFEYVKANRSFIQQKIILSAQDLQLYFQENKDNFENENFKQVKNQVKEALLNDRTIEFANELARNLEEDVAGGLTLQEIANKYDFPIQKVKAISLEEMIQNDDPDCIELADSVFEMAQNEVSYPIEVEDTFDILLVNLTDIEQSREREFVEVEKEIEALINEEMLAKHNIHFLEGIKHSYLEEKKNKLALGRNGVHIISNQAFARANLFEENTLPVTLLQAIFAIEKNALTNIVTVDNKSYFGHVKQVKYDAKLAKKIHQNSDAYFTNLIQEGVFSELIQHLTQQNNMQIKAILD